MRRPAASSGGGGQWRDPSGLDAFRGMHQVGDTPICAIAGRGGLTVCLAAAIVCASPEAACQRADSIWRLPDQAGRRVDARRGAAGYLLSPPPRGREACAAVPAFVGPSAAGSLQVCITRVVLTSAVRQCQGPQQHSSSGAEGWSCWRSGGDMRRQSAALLGQCTVIPAAGHADGDSMAKCTLMTCAARW